MAKNARQTAVEALLQVHEQGGYSNIVFHNTAKRNALSAQDTALAGVLFYGVLERCITLDHILKHYSQKPIRKLSPAVREILRISLYQMLYLDHIPDSAAVNEGVKLTRIFKVSSASGFVNGILRAFLREGKTVPKVQGGESERLSIEYSCPSALIDLLLKSCERADVLSLLRYSLGRPPLYARINTIKQDDEKTIAILRENGVSVTKDTEVDHCVLLESTASLERLQAFQDGLFYIQDKASQMCAHFLGAQPGERILDVCAAPGSKSFTIAQDMGNVGEIVSCDIYEEKVAKIKEGAQRLGLHCIQALLNDATSYQETLGQFDRILCDVPCSGLGIIGRKPEIKYKDTEEFKQLPPLQETILEISSRYLKAGGTLVYSTCTVLPRENQELVSRFLEKHTDFEPEYHTTHTAQWYSALFPNRHNTDGFFIATIRKNG